MDALTEKSFACCYAVCKQMGLAFVDNSKYMVELTLLELHFSM